MTESLIEKLERPDPILYAHRIFCLLHERLPKDVPANRDDLQALAMELVGQYSPHPAPAEVVEAMHAIHRHLKRLQAWVSQDPTQPTPPKAQEWVRGEIEAAIRAYKQAKQSLTKENV